MFQETDRRFQETDRKFRETDRKFGELGNRLGEFVQEMVRPAAVEMFQSRGIAVHEVHREVYSKRGNLATEIDLLVVNDTDIVAIECKSKLTVEDVKYHLERLTKVKILFPKYADMTLYGAVAGMVVTQEALDYAAKQGLFVIGQSGESVEIKNDKDFLPKVF